MEEEMESPGTSETWRFHCKDGCNLELKIDRFGC